MQLTVQAAIPFLTALCFAGLAVLVWVQAKRRDVGTRLTAYLVLMAAWSLSSSMMHADVAPGHTVWWNRIVIALGVCYALLYYHFIRTYLGGAGLDGWLRVGYALAGPAVAYTLLGDVVRHAELVDGGFRTQFGTGLYAVVTPYALVFQGLVAYTLVAQYRRTRDHRLRTRLFYLLAGYAVATLASFTNFDSALVRYPVDQAGNLVNGLVIAYVVLRHDLLETGVLLRRGALYALLTVIISTIYLMTVLGAMLLFRTEVKPAEALLGFLLAVLVGFVFQPLRAAVQGCVDRAFFRERYDYRVLLGESSRLVASSLELEVVCSRILELVGGAMHVDRLGLFVLDVEQRLYRPVVADANYQRELKLDHRHPVAQHLERTNTPLDKEEILARPQFYSLWQSERQQLRGLDFELLVPLVAKGLLVGILVLGRKRSEQPYTAEDTALLNTVGNQAAVAVDNARLYTEMVWAYRQLQEAQSKLVQLERLRALGEMAGGVAHTFNNVLAGILGRTQLLIEDVTDERLRRDLQVVERVTLDAAQTVRRIQEFARVRTDQSFVPVDVNAVVEESLELVKPKLEEQAALGGQVRLVTRLEAKGWVKGNGVDLKEALCNILLNAIDAMPRGGLLTIVTRDQSDSVLLSVADTGMGMAAEVQERIFEPFFTTKGAQGTGLGLSVAYGTITRHQGTISVESAPGRGTTFLLRFPARRRIQAPSIPGLARGASSAKARVLVVDDDVDVCEALGQMLSGMGYEVRSAYGGREALHLAQQEHFDLVLTDLGMPDLSGREVAAKLRGLDSDTRVVLITGWGLQLDPQKLAQEGIDAVLAKPFGKEELQRVTAGVLGSQIWDWRIYETRRAEQLPNPGRG